MLCGTNNPTNPSMTYTIKLSKADTECLRQTVTEAQNNGKEHALGDDTTKLNCGHYYKRLLAQIECQAQHIAERAFEAGQKAQHLQ